MRRSESYLTVPLLTLRAEDQQALMTKAFVCAATLLVMTDQATGDSPREFASSSTVRKYFLEDWAIAKGFTMVPKEAAFSVYKEMFLLSETQVTGAVVEAGVWRGGSSMLMAMAHKRVVHSADRHEHRSFWLYDTFDGLPAPGVEDGAKVNDIFKALQAFKNGTANEKQRRIVTERGAKGWINMTVGKWDFGPLDEVQRNMHRVMGVHHATNVHYVVGKVEDTLRMDAPANALPERICLLRLDTDFYSSTAVELSVLWPRLQPGGLLLVDDYFAYGGARKAVDDWLQAHNWTKYASGLHSTKAYPWHVRKIGAFVGPH